MPIGVIINALSVASGGVIGALFGHKLPEKFNSELTKIFGVCSMGMGVSSIGLMKNMPAVILSIILGTVIGLIIHFGKLIQKMGMGMEKVISKVIPGQNKTDEEFPIADMIPAMVLVMPLSHLWVTYVMPFVS